MTSMIRSAAFTDLSVAHSGAVTEIIVAVALRLALWERRAKTRAALARLDENQLRDIGIDPLSAALEAGRPFWKG